MIRLNRADKISAWHIHRTSRGDTTKLRRKGKRTIMHAIERNEAFSRLSRLGGDRRTDGPLPVPLGNGATRLGLPSRVKIRKMALPLNRFTSTQTFMLCLRPLLKIMHPRLRGQQLDEILLLKNVCRGRPEQSTPTTSLTNFPVVIRRGVPGRIASLLHVYAIP